MISGLMRFVLAFILLFATGSCALALSEDVVRDRMIALYSGEPGCTPGTAPPGWDRRSVINPADGYRVRYSRFGCDLGPDGAIVLLPGRSEGAYEYYETAMDFIARGYGPVYVVDHRGQGLSPRLLDDLHKGHVARFEDYIADTEVFVAEVLADLDVLGAGPEPTLHLTSNSMGGAIAVGYLQKLGADAPFRSAALLGAMIEVNYISFTGKPSNWLNLRVYSEAGALAQALWRCEIATLWDDTRCADFAVPGAFARYTPGSRRFRPDSQAMMTHSAARYDLRTYMLDEFDWSGIAATEYADDEAWDGPQLGGATNSWVLEAARFNRQMRKPGALARMTHVPLMIMTGSADHRSYREYADWRNKTPDLSRHIDFCATVNAASLKAGRGYLCEFVSLNGGYHELYKESDALRTQAIDTVDWFFRKHQD